MRLYVTPLGHARAKNVTDADRVADLYWEMLAFLDASPAGATVATMLAEMEYSRDWTDEFWYVFGHLEQDGLATSRKSGSYYA